MVLEYNDYSFGIVQGCERMSPGCAHCYAERNAKDYGIKVGGLPVWGPAPATPRKVHGAKHWNGPLGWNAIKIPIPGKTRPNVFCSPMADVFEDHPTVDHERVKLWDLIQKTPNLDWHLITKREDNVEKNLPWGKTGVPSRNVWISMSIENNYWAKRRLPYLASLNVAVRGAHLEPLLGPVPSLAQYIKDLDWVLVGGEQRDDDPPKTRPMQPAWVLDVKTICDGAGVPFFFKQWGGKKAFKSPSGAVVFKPMKHYYAGRTLMGQEWLGWPVPKIGKPR